MRKPTVYLLCGLPGSGKTTYANKLIADNNVTKVSIDETMTELFGVVGKDFALEDYSQNKKLVMELVKKQIADNISDDKSLVLDFGVWKKKDRDYFKSLVENNGGECKLIYFKASKDTLIKRLNKRREIENGKLFSITESMLDESIDKFEEPIGENAEVIEQV